MSLTVLEPLDARIPKWDLNNLHTRVCPFCGKSNQPAFKRPDQLSVALCYTCGCWYVDRMPPAKSISAFYDGYYYNHFPITDFSKKSISKMIKNARKESETNWQLQALDKILGGLHGRRILDVGCGIGKFLLSARCLGAEVVGCDLSPEASSFAQNTFNIHVHQSNLASCSSSIGSFDAVVMRDFIEHPVEPSLDIQAAIKILNPAGILLMVTPNGGEAGADIETAKGWIGFRVDLEHLQYLSPQTVNWLSRNYDLIIERIQTYGFPNLKGIEEFNTLLNRGAGTVHSIKGTLGRIPGARKTLKILRMLKTEITGGNPGKIKYGSYHLFAILRKS